ncbi:MAG: AfsR/SARP family transcriptional regulator, partial [bacterium]
MTETMPSHSHANGGYHLHFRTNAAGQRGDWHQATEYARTALAMAIEAGVPFLEGHCRIDLARALLGRGDGAEWVEHLAAARASGQAMGSRVLEYLCLETEAMAAFKQGKESLGLDRLAQALALSREMDGAYWLLAGPQASAELYDRALAAGIEVDHVQRLIRRRRLIAPDPTLCADHWPWPVKVYTLGCFDLIVDGAPLRVADKGQKKPLELFMALVALGGRQVPQTRLADLLWPDAEGDAAYRALITTLQRLRRLLGEPRAITFQDGCLSVDGRQVWVDAWAFERALGKTAQPQGQDALSNVERALRLYH